MLSFVIPVYKTPEQLLRNCLDSVLRYSQPMELICVLDSPGDPCEQVLDEYAAKDPRMRLLKNDQNRGVSFSRNRGMDVATGDYFAFVDADDEIIAETYEKAAALAVEKKVDGCAFTSGKPNVARYGVKYGESVVGTIKDRAVAKVLARGYSMAVFPMVLRRGLLVEKGIRFLQGHRYGEDFMVVVKILCTGGRFAYWNLTGYKYVGHPDSACRCAPNTERYTHGLIAVLTVLRMVASVDADAETRRWYLSICLPMVLFDRTAVRYVKGMARWDYCANLKALAKLMVGGYANLFRTPSRLVFGVVQRWPKLWFLPGMPFSQTLRFFNHFGLMLRRV